MSGIDRNSDAYCRKICDLRRSGGLRDGGCVAGYRMPGGMTGCSNEDAGVMAVVAAAIDAGRCCPCCGGCCRIHVDMYLQIWFGYLD